MGISYNSKKIIPAPFVTIQKQYLRNESTGKVGCLFGITLTGKLLARRGSPSTDGAFHDGSGYPEDEDAPASNGLIRKTEALRKLFAEDGRWLEISLCDGATPMKCRPIIKDISFTEGPWVDYVDYTITLETVDLFGLGNTEDVELRNNYFVVNNQQLALMNVHESWAIEPQDMRETPSIGVFRLTHQISAAGRDRYNDGGALVPGYKQAQIWVKSRAGYTDAYLYSPTGLNVPTYYRGFNHARVEQLDEQAGTFAINENWILASGYASDEYSISVRNSIEDGLTRISVEGSINGFEESSPTGMYEITTSKIDNADRKWTELTQGAPYNTIYMRALRAISPASMDISTLDSKPVVTNVGRNYVNGTITYSYEFNNRGPTCMVAPDGVTRALSESIVVSDDNKANIFARIIVPGRLAGPVLQDLGTVTETRRSLIIEAVMPTPTGLGCLSSTTNVSRLLNTKPKGSSDAIVWAFYQELVSNNSQVLVERDRETWDAFRGRYTRDVSWVYQNCPPSN